MTASSGTSAGVYINEVNLSQQISAVSTSIGAIVGSISKGSNKFTYANYRRYKFY